MSINKADKVADKVLEGAVITAGITLVTSGLGAIADKGIEMVTGKKSNTGLAAGATIGAILSGLVGMTDAANEIDIAQKENGASL